MAFSVKDSGGRSTTSIAIGIDDGYYGCLKRLWEKDLYCYKDSLLPCIKELEVPVFQLPCRPWPD